MSYEAKLEVRDGNLWESYDSDDADMDMGPVARHVAYALDVLRAAGWDVVIEDEYGDYYIMSERAKVTVSKRTVVRSPWRKVES